MKLAHKEWEMHGRRGLSLFEYSESTLVYIVEEPTFGSVKHLGCQSALLALDVSNGEPSGKPIHHIRRSL